MTGRQRGVTLIEMLVVLAILGVMTTIAYPSITAGLDSLRLNTASDEVIRLLHDAANRAERRQQAVEVQIHERYIEAVAPGWSDRLDLGELRAVARPSFFLEPGALLPALSVDLRTSRGHTRRVTIDPISGAAEVGDAPKNP